MFEVERGREERRGRGAIGESERDRREGEMERKEKRGLVREKGRGRESIKEKKKWGKGERKRRRGEERWG